MRCFTHLPFWLCFLFLLTFGTSNVDFVATTPIHIDQLNKELIFHPNKEFTSFLLSGFREGFDTGVSKVRDESFECQNLRSAPRDPPAVTGVVDDKLNKVYLIGYATFT